MMLSMFRFFAHRFHFQNMVLSSTMPETEMKFKDINQLVPFVRAQTSCVYFELDWQVDILVSSFHSNLSSLLLSIVMFPGSLLPTMYC